MLIMMRRGLMKTSLQLGPRLATLLTSGVAGSGSNHEYSTAPPSEPLVDDIVLLRERAGERGRLRAFDVSGWLALEPALTLLGRNSAFDLGTKEQRHINREVCVGKGGNVLAALLR
jgi:hypothetical protein